MKKNILKITLIGAITVTSIGINATNTVATTINILNEETTTETFKVYGNCGMCKKTIEGALKNVEGIKKASWNKETKMMEVTFNEEQIPLDQIKMKIAEVGYDTEEHRASKEVYDNLPGCCQYERPEQK